MGQPCHVERSDAFRYPTGQILRCAQHDNCVVRMTVLGYLG